MRKHILNSISQFSFNSISSYCKFTFTSVDVTTAYKNEIHKTNVVARVFHEGIVAGENKNRAIDSK